MTRKAPAPSQPSPESNQGTPRLSQVQDGQLPESFWSDLLTSAVLIAVVVWFSLTTQLGDDLGLKPDEGVWACAPAILFVWMLAPTTALEWLNGGSPSKAYVLGIAVAGVAAAGWFAPALPVFVVAAGLSLALLQMGRELSRDD